ncbi:MAG: protoheme IX farnesyltransferase, partial [Bradyrhizobium sp.]|nr:protoheme IX farnesyltransferase [Bradyrhizobium sp.]
MSVIDQNAIAVGPRISEADVGDYLALLKPRVMSLVIFTALIGLLIAPGHFHPVLAITSLLCIAVAMLSSLAPLTRSTARSCARPPRARASRTAR